MLNKTNVLAAIIAAVIVLGAAIWFYRDELRISTAVSAEEGQSDYADIFADETGDDEIIAIGGTNPDGVITRGNIRVMAEFHAVHQKELSMDDAIGMVIVPLLDGAILYEEAVRLGHKLQMKRFRLT